MNVARHEVCSRGPLGLWSPGPRNPRAAIAAGVSGVFMETHPDPEKALSDGPNSWPLDRMKELLETLKLLDSTVKQSGLIETTL